LEWDVSQRKVEASQNKKFSLHRKAVVFGGMIIAGGVGAATSVWERLQKGEHDLRFLGAAALLGAGVGFGAAKAYQPAEDDTTVTAHAQEAREVVRRAYDKSSSDDVAHRAIGIESVREATKR